MFSVSYVYHGTDDYGLVDGGTYSTIKEAEKALSKIIEKEGHNITGSWIEEVVSK